MLNFGTMVNINSWRHLVNSKVAKKPCFENYFSKIFRSIFRSERFKSAKKQLLTSFTPKSYLKSAMVFTAATLFIFPSSRLFQDNEQPENSKFAKK
jgi:hypothetical protein